MDTYTLIETLVITVLAALLGLSLPLIMQTIERLDAKYGSAVLSSAFRKGWKYRLYFIMIWISIAFMLWLPWAPEPIECLRRNWLANHSAHILSWSSLVFTLIMLFLIFLDIMTFESPDDLLKKLTELSPDNPGGTDRNIQKLISNKDQFDQFGTVMKYSMTVGNTTLYLNCNSVLGSCIGLCRKDTLQGEAIVYPDSIYNLINEALRISQRFYDELLYPSLNNPQTFLSVYFDVYGHTTMSQDTLRQLWMNLSQLSRCNKPDWIKGYWVYATQYADYTVAQRILIPADLFEIEEAYKNDEDISGFDQDIKEKWNIHQNYIKEANALRLLHHMFSAYLLYEEKSDVVKWTFTFTPSSLRTLLLIPHNISAIVSELVEINRNPFLLESNFSFFSEEGIDTVFLMRDWLMKFYIFALDTQYCLFNKGIVRHDPWNAENLYTIKKPRKIHEMMSAVERLSVQLYPNSVYYESLEIDITRLKDIYDHLKVILDKLGEAVNNIVASSGVNQEDLDIAKQSLINGQMYIIKGLNQKEPSVRKENSIITKLVPLTIGLTINKSDFIYESDRFCQNSAPHLLSGMHAQMARYYISIFRFANSLKNINIDFSEINEALNRLKIAEVKDYILVPIDTSLREEYKNLSVSPLYGSGQPQIIIIPKEELPAAQVDPAGEIELETSERDNLVIIKAEAKGLLKYPSNLRFIRLIVVNSLFDGRKSELSSIKPIEAYFTK